MKRQASCKGKEEEADGNTSATGIPTCFEPSKMLTKPSRVHYQHFI